MWPGDCWGPSDLRSAASQPVVFHHFCRFLGTSQQHLILALFFMLLYSEKSYFKTIKSGNSLAVQQLELHASTPGNPGSAPDQRTKIPQASQSVQSLSCVRLCNPMDCSMPALPVPHYLPKFTQIHTQCISDAIQPSHNLLRGQQSHSLPIFYIIISSNI